MEGFTFSDVRVHREYMWASVSEGHARYVDFGVEFRDLAAFPNLRNHSKSLYISVTSFKLFTVYSDLCEDTSWRNQSEVGRDRVQDTDISLQECKPAKLISRIMQTHFP